MSKMSDQSVIVREVFDKSHGIVSLLRDLTILSEEKRIELENHARAIGAALAPIVDLDLHELD